VSGYSDGGLARSTDRGDHWEDITFDEISWYMADIALSPHYAQDQTVIVAADSKPPYISEDGGATWFPLQGIPPVGGYGAKYDLAITYEDGLLCPLATTPSSFFRYGWPQLNTPNPIRIGLQMDITDTVHTIIPLSATEPGEAPWQLQENAA